MEYFLFPFGDVGRYEKYGSLGDSQGYAAWWCLSQNADCACPPKAAVRERHHLNHAVVPIRVLRAVWIGGPWLDGYHRSLKLQESFFQQIDQQNSRVFGKERDAVIRWTWWEDSREIWRGHAFERSETLLPRLTQKVNASEKKGDEKWTSVAGAAVPTPSKLGSDMKVLCRAALLLLSKKKSGYGGGTAGGCVLDAPPQPVCHWSRWSAEDDNGDDWSVSRPSLSVASMSCCFSMEMRWIGVDM